MSREKDAADPKGLIRESFRIEGISEPECRSIFMDWALSVDATDHRPLIAALLARHADAPPDHPMTAVLTEGLTAAPAARRRGGRRARVEEE